MVTGDSNKNSAADRPSFTPVAQAPYMPSSHASMSRASAIVAGGASVIKIHSTLDFDSRKEIVEKS
jgi:hypothetical protein